MGLGWGGGRGWGEKGAKLPFFIKSLWLQVPKLRLNYILTKIKKKGDCNPKKGCQPHPFLPDTCHRPAKMGEFLDLRKHNHAIYHLKENLVLNNIFHIRKFQINP